MAIRLIKCAHCDHMVRLGSLKCGSCGATTSVFNWTITHIIMLGIVVVVGIVGVSLI